MSSLCRSVLLGAGLALALTFAQSREAFSGRRDQAMELPPPCLCLGSPAPPLLNPFDGPSVVAFHPDLPLAAIPGGEFIWVGDPFTSRLARKLPLRGVAALAFSPDGKVLAVAVQDLQLWSVSTGKLLRRFGKALGANARLVFSGDGKLLVSTNPDCSADLWDPATGKRQGRITGVGASTMALSFDGKLLACGGPENTVALWDTRAQKRLHCCKGHTDQVTCLAFSADGQTLASGSNDCSIRLWETQTGKERRCLEGVLPGATHGHTAGIRALAWSAGGHLLLSAADDRTILLWDARTGETFSRHLLAPEPRALFASRDGKTIACLAVDGTFSFWQITKASRLRPVPSSGWPIDVLAFLPGGKRLSAMDRTGSVRTWDVHTGKEIAATPSDHVRGVVLANPDVQAIVDPLLDYFAAEDGDREMAMALVLRKTTSGKAISRLTFTGRPQVVAASPDSALLAVAAGDKDVSVWSVPSGQRLHQLDGPPGWNGGAGLLGVGVGALGGPLLRNCPPGGLASGMSGFGALGVGGGSDFQAGGLNALIFSPDGETLAGCWDESFRLWDVATGRICRSFRRTEPELLWGGEDIVFSRDGKSLAASRAGFLRLWEVRTGKLRASLSIFKHIRAELRIALSPNQRTLAVAHWNTRTIDLWDLFTESKEHTFATEQAVTALAFSPDGKLLASGGLDSTVRLWDLSARKWAPPPPTEPLDAADLEDAWKDLARPNAARAYRALAALAQSPRASVPFLKRRLKPVPVASDRELDQLVANLDSDHYSVREAAYKKLLEWGSQAEPVLVDALKQRPSPEVRWRIKRILKRLDSQPIDTDYLRQLRALEALECAGTPEACEVLAALARGDANASLTREAAAARKRLALRLPRP